MLLAPQHGFVFLSVTKSASTSIEDAFAPYSQIALRGNPFKHTRYAGFQRFMQPYLASKGFDRNSYEVVCVFREPIDWLSSWYRYRAREELADPSHPTHNNYTGDVSFEEFSRAFMNGGTQFAQLGRQAEFVEPRGPNWRPVDRVFRYDRLDLLVDYLCEKVGDDVEVGYRNVSPKISHSLSRKHKRELRTFLEPEYTIYKRSISK